MALIKYLNDIRTQLQKHNGQPAVALLLVLMILNGLIDEGSAAIAVTALLAFCGVIFVMARLAAEERSATVTPSVSD